jgi:hypothetical protein
MAMPHISVFSDKLFFFQLMPGIEYKVSVTGTNMLGTQGKTQQFSFQVVPNTKKSGSEDEISSSQLVLVGPATTLSNAITYIEAKFVSCEPQVRKPSVNVSMHHEKCLGSSCSSSDFKK